MKLLMAFGFDIVWIIALWWLLWGRIRFATFRAWWGFNLLFVILLGVVSVWSVSLSGLMLDIRVRTWLLFVWALGFWGLLQLHFAFAFKDPVKTLYASGFIFIWFFVRLFLLKEQMGSGAMQLLTLLLGIGALLFWWQLFSHRGYNVSEYGK